MPETPAGYPPPPLLPLSGGSKFRRADVILVVHGGRIVESGSHRELMAEKGAYWQLYTRQYREEQTRSIMET